MTLRGLDTSNNNPGVPDKSIAGDFIIFKATEGVGYVDPDCNPSYQEAKAAGKLVGVYHYARPDGNDPISEADFFVNNIQGYIGDTLLALDWETEPKSNVMWAKQWLDHVYQRTGVRPLIYMSTSVANAYDWSPVWNDYALWVAQYYDMNTDFNYDMSQAGPLPDVKWPNTYAMWQWTSRGRIDGYNGNLDCNIFYGDVEAWKKFANPNHQAPVPVKQPIVEVKNEIVVKSIPYTSKSVNDGSLARGQLLTTVGKNGVETITYKVTYTDGTETAREVVSDVVTTPPIEEIVTIGTKTAEPQPTRIQTLVQWMNDHPIVARAAHTFWQAFVATFVLGWPAIQASIFQEKISVSFAAAFALLIASASAGLSAVKTALVEKNKI